MPLHLKKNLADRTADEISKLINLGRWRDTLPSERNLAQELGVSRSTLRTALTQLINQGILNKKQGKSTRIVHRNITESPPPSKVVAFLTPLPIGSFFTHYEYPLWYEALELKLRRRGYDLELLYLPQLSGKSLDHKLKSLIRRHSINACMLHQSSLPLQNWFSQNKLPAVVIGSLQQGVNLAAYDVDNRAVCRHAANTLLRIGHERIAFLVPESGLAGDLLSESGFNEAISSATRSDGIIFRHKGTPQSQRIVLQRILSATPRITGLIISHAKDVPLVMITAAELGRPIPQEISIISLKDHGFLNLLLPLPSKYVIDDTVFASGLARTLDTQIKQGHYECKNTFVFPDYIEGASVQSLK
ncbi:GntR family transcriptional regulator [Coraliomargarita sp. SDUM461004]|uniref:GntR family transcriptional regulator n=1 Tax=Thalassobacterium sedimentorum TaxID=3041258 RepID=A0ABU1AMW8_9BACT|nr:GntR family transcriptional regulator [Coraliomargarita sp. SDUM461004]MDQ8196140.1 GntR family transcriptional regulator [Coraliomargarita sp. SDUM461004]